MDPPATPATAHHQAVISSWYNQQLERHRASLRKTNLNSASADDCTVREAMRKFPESRGPGDGVRQIQRQRTNPSSPPGIAGGPTVTSQPLLSSMPEPCPRDAGRSGLLGVEGIKGGRQEGRRRAVKGRFQPQAAREAAGLTAAAISALPAPPRTGLAVVRGTQRPPGPGCSAVPPAGACAGLGLAAAPPPAAPAAAPRARHAAKRPEAAI